MREISGQQEYYQLEAYLNKVCSVSQSYRDLGASAALELDSFIQAIMFYGTWIPVDCFEMRCV